LRTLGNINELDDDQWTLTPSIRVEENMKPQGKFQYRLTSSEHTALRIKSLQEGISLSEMTEAILLDVLEGRLDLTEVEDDAQPTSSTISADVIARFNAYAKERGVPKNKLVRLAVAAKLRTQPEMFAAIDALTHKHRHSNSNSNKS